MSKTQFQKGQVANPNGRRGKEKTPLPPELRRMLAKLKVATPKALDIIIQQMTKTLPNGEVLEDAKMAEKIIQLYFTTLRAKQDLEAKETKEAPPAENSRPKFTMEVVNPSTDNVVKIAQK